VAKPKFRITNWNTYNKALINSGSMTFWLDDEAIKSWYDTSPPSARGRPRRYSDLAITTVLVIKRVFRLTLRAAQSFIDSTGLKVFGEGEWKVKKHGKERWRIWRKLHLAVDSKTHEISCADLSLNNVTDSEAFRGLSCRPIGKSGQQPLMVLTILGYVTMNCGVRKSARLFLPENVRLTGRASMQTATVPLRISG
jgi:hypothetical protein